MTHSGIQLSLLEGMDEDLLLRLHEHGIHTRHELEAGLASPEARADLAQTLRVPVMRLEAIHHLNFLLPEERVARFLRLERGQDERLRRLTAEVRSVRRFSTVIALVLMATVLLYAFFLWRPEAGPARVSAPSAELDQLRARLDALAPLARGQAEARLHTAIAKLGPAPNWSGPLPWNESEFRTFTDNLNGDSTAIPVRAVGVALLRLVRLENAPLDSLNVAERAAAAAELTAAFPPIGRPRTLWDAAAMQLRLRFTGRALGFAPLEPVSADAFRAVPGEWTHPGFLQAEILVARLESLPITREAVDLWAETLILLRETVNEARDDLGERPEAYAREYWLRRGELEFAVVGALLGRANLLPYSPETPAAFLGQRAGFLDKAIERAPSAARGPLTWLALEHEEARRLLVWVADRPAALAQAKGLNWVEAMGAMETRRTEEAQPLGRDLDARVSAALQASGLNPATPVTNPRTAWEAGLRPLLMETRDRLEREAASHARGDGAP